MQMCFTVTKVLKRVAAVVLYEKRYKIACFLEVIKI